MSDNPLVLLASLDTTVPVSQVVDVMNAVDAYVRRAKEFKVQLEQAMIEWIKANGDIEIGTVRYYVGTEKETKCVDQREALEAFLDAAGGDLDAVSTMLASGAFKHGAARALLDEERYAKLFVTTEKSKLKEGKPDRKLIRVDSQYVRQNEPEQEKDRS